MAPTGPAQLFDSSAFWGGLWLAVLGAVSTTVWLGARRLVDFVTRNFIVTAEISNSEEAFEWLLYWVSQQKGVLSAKNLKLAIKRNRTSEHFWSDDTAGSSEKAKLEFLPGAGVHMFRYKNRMITMTRTAGKMLQSGWDNKPTTFETLSLMTWGRGKAIFEDLFTDAMNMSLKKDADKTHIYVLNSWGGGWIKALSKEPRKLESVILDAGLTKSLLDDVKEFRRSEEWYRSRGIPWRRGYLLYGPPGCGKTSFVTAMAADIQVSICVLNLSNPTLHDARLNSRLRETPAGSIILLEDVDAIFIARDVGERRTGVTFSGLLNAIDGVASQENRILVMTTNHLNKLDPALIRPGRCDVHVKFDFASPVQVRAMFVRFFPEEASAADVFSARLAGLQLNMASLQGYLMKHRDDAAQALACTDELKQQQVSVDSGVMGIEEWLRRLGLEQYTRRFTRANLLSVADISSMGEYNFEALGVKVLGHRRRMAAMLASRTDVKAQFAFANPSQAEALFLQAYADDRHSSEGDPMSTLAGGSSLGGAGAPAGGSPRRAQAGAGPDLLGGGEEGDSDGGRPAPRGSTAPEVDTAALAEMAAQFGAAVPPATLSMAQVMKHCARFPGRPDLALSTVDALVAASTRATGRGLLCDTGFSLLVGTGAHKKPVGGGGSGKGSDGSAEGKRGGGASADAEDGDEDGDDSEDALDLGQWLSRLGLARYEAGIRRAGLRTVGHLRRAKDELAGMGVDVLGHRRLIEDKLEDMAEANVMYSCVSSASQVRRVFAEVYPWAEVGLARDFANTVFPTGAPAARVTVGQVREHCERHRSLDSEGRALEDASGVRAVAAAHELVDLGARRGTCATAAAGPGAAVAVASAAPADGGARVAPAEADKADASVRDTSVMLRRLALPHLIPELWKHGVFSVDVLRGGGDGVAATAAPEKTAITQALQEQYGVTNPVEAGLIGGFVAGAPDALAAFALVRSPERAQELFREVFPDASADDAAAFAAAVPMGLVSAAQVRAHCERWRFPDPSDPATEEASGATAIAKAAERLAVMAKGSPESGEHKGDDADAASDKGKGKGKGEGKGKAKGADKEAALITEPIGPWLTRLKLAHLEAALAAEGFDCATLLADATDAELSAIGVKPMGARARLLAAAAKFKTATAGCK